jgi:hypothetical protein
LALFLIQSAYRTWSDENELNFGNGDEAAMHWLVPGRIVVAVVAEFGLYGFGHVRDPLTELLRILDALGNATAVTDLSRVRIVVSVVTKFGL